MEKCLVCFKNLSEEYSLSSLFSFPRSLCDNCKKKMELLNKEEEIFGIKIYFLYRYNDFMKSIIYQYKGCYDLELKKVFFGDFINKINRKYKGYTIIYPPSNDEDDIKRGFNHVKEIALETSLKIEDLFYKKINYKQSDQSFKNRKNIEKIIDFRNDIKVINKKYLILDDIFTSGSTINAIIKKLTSRKVGLNNIKALIICRSLHD